MTGIGLFEKKKTYQDIIKNEKEFFELINGNRMQNITDSLGKVLSTFFGSGLITIIR